MSGRLLTISVSRFTSLKGMSNPIIRDPHVGILINATPILFIAVRCPSSLWIFLFVVAVGEPTFLLLCILLDGAMFWYVENWPHLQC